MGLPDVGGEFGSCSVCLMDFTKLDLQRIPYSSIISYKGVTLRASYTKYKCMGCYDKLAAFTPNAKDV
ncbi:SsrA-binding protein [Helicobacter pylori]|uniref:SsrA-binding protein n=1 Tax=Helicobacter pylori TaxID=210 RepID=UPI002159C6E4|nr:SsrA-binding protein [Helicobacter pylori]